MPPRHRWIQLLSSAHRRLQWRLSLEQAQQSAPDIAAPTAAQAAVLLLLAQSDGASMGQLAQAMDLVPSAVSGLVQRMQQHGWVNQSRCTTDNRTQRVWLLDAGRLQLPAIQRALKHLNTELTNGFSSQELATVARWLRHVQQLPAPLPLTFD